MGWVNRLIRKHPIRLPAIIVAIGVAILGIAYFTGTWRLAMLAALPLLVFVPMLIVGLVRRASQAAKGPLHCPECDAVETASPGFGRVKPKWVDYEIITCRKCGASWQEYF